MRYNLPKELIAQRPCEPRDAARLLVLDRTVGEISHRIFRELPGLLRAGEILVLNDTKVMPARLYGKRADTGGKVELLILRPAQDERGSVQDKGGLIWRCLGRPGKGLREGAKILLNHGSVQAEVVAAEGQERLVRFDRSVEEILNQWGKIPLPPYIRRAAEPEDARWYQTVYADQPGAVAAPTAGLHFTQELLDRIRAMGVQVAFVTLHVGWGTFKPVREEEIRSGKLHAERFRIPEETVAAIRRTKGQGGRVIAVGTTVVRALETFGLPLNRLGSGGQSEGLVCHSAFGRSSSRIATQPVSEGETISWFPPQNSPIQQKQSVSLGEISHLPQHPPLPEEAQISCDLPVEGVTDLFIQPGFRFRVVDGLVTNFHLPGTSLLMLVSAFAGEERIRTAYAEAVRRRYRFYSYGDAMLITQAGQQG